ncbi:MAG: DEAD/DEAH box helicase [Myxococcota bacterium]
MKTPAAALSSSSLAAAAPLEPDAPDSGDDIETAADEAIGFAALGLDPAVLRVLVGLGFERPTPIQAAAIPPLMAGSDVIGRARTGTGKTAAFGLPLLARTGKPITGKPQALIMAPTRELALQVTEALKQLASRPLRIITVYGGAPYGPQLRALREGVEVVVGTPGRIIDLMERKSLVLDAVRIVVLDEADEMLKMGFIDDVEKILAETPDTRQVALFSATMPAPIKKIAERWLKTPVHATDAEGASIAAIDQRYVLVPSRNKREALLRILKGEPRGAAIIFAATKVQCAEVAESLSQAGFAAEELHGDLSQPARERVIQLLRDKRVDMVVATDIAARGIDIDHLTHIINLELPKSVEVYTHRIGRTGRAGRSGTAITLLAPRDVPGFVNAIQRQGATIREMFLPSDAELVRRRRDAMAAELRAWVGPSAVAATEGEGDEAVVETKATRESGEPAEARRWLGQLVASGWDLEDLATAALGLLAKSRSVSLEAAPDKGLPPWARQATAPAPTQRSVKPGRPALHAIDDAEPIQRPARPPCAGSQRADGHAPAGAWRGRVAPPRGGAHAGHPPGRRGRRAGQRARRGRAVDRPHRGARPDDAGAGDARLRGASRPGRLAGADSRHRDRDPRARGAAPDRAVDASSRQAGAAGTAPRAAHRPARAAPAQSSRRLTTTGSPARDGVTSAIPSGSLSADLRARCARSGRSAPRPSDGIPSEAAARLWNAAPRRSS